MPKHFFEILFTLAGKKTSPDTAYARQTPVDRPPVTCHVRSKQDCISLGGNPSRVWGGGTEGVT